MTDTSPRDDQRPLPGGTAEPEWVDTTWQATWCAEARGRGVARTCAGAVWLDYDPATGWDREVSRRVDGIPGARDDPQEGWRQAQAGGTIPLDPR